jgi:hypothetical protein
MTGAMAIFHYLGLIPGGSTPSLLLDLVLNPQNLQTSELYTQIRLAIAAVALVGISIGIIIGKADQAVVAGVALYLLTLGMDFVALFTVVNAAAPVFAVLLCGPLLIMYLFTVVEWWRGMN